MSQATVKVSELTGGALDWAVAKAEGFRVEVYEHRLGPLAGIFFETPDPKDRDRAHVYTPSENWSEAGPIIEREKIDLDHAIVEDTQPMALLTNPSTYQIFGANGPTILIAAMRCYVTSKLGPSVDVPAELMKERAS